MTIRSLLIARHGAMIFVNSRHFRNAIGNACGNPVGEYFLEKALEALRRTFTFLRMFLAASSEIRLPYLDGSNQFAAGRNA